MTHIWLAMGLAEILLSAYVMRRVWLRRKRTKMLEIRVREIRKQSLADFHRTGINSQGADGPAGQIWQW